MKIGYNSNGEKMKYIKEDNKTYTINTIKTSKFDTITMELKFRNVIKEDDLITRMFLTNILSASTKEFPTTRLLSIEGENLYDIKYSFSTERIGNYVETTLIAKFVNPKYTSSDMLKKSIKYIFDMIFNPNIENNLFSTLDYKYAYNKMIELTASSKEDMKIYSAIRMYEELGKKTPISYNICNKESVIKKITNDSLYSYYKNMIKSDYFDIYIIGEFDEKEAISYIKEICPINTVKKSKKELVIEHKKLKSRITNVVEYEDINQAKLTIGCKTSDVTLFERLYVAPIFNEIYGGSSDAKLFKNIREKHSLAYYIYSTLKLLDNIMYVYCGIDSNDVNKVTKLVKKYYNEMKEGLFTEEDINRAKTNYKASLNRIEESPSSIIQVYYAKNILNSDLLEERYKKIEEVTYEDIVMFASKIHFDTSFVVKGGKHERV